MDEKEKLKSELHREGLSRKARETALQKLAGISDLSSLDYDYQGAMNAGMVPDQRGHWDNKFKKMSHITAGDDSVYSNPITQGGQWSKLSTPLPSGEEWQFEPSMYQQLRIPEEQYRNYFNQNESGVGGAVLNYPEEKRLPVIRNGIIQNIIKKGEKK